MKPRRKSLKGYGAPFTSDKSVAPNTNNTQFGGSIYQFDNKDEANFVFYNEAWDYHLRQVDWALFITFTWRERAKRSHSSAGHDKRKRDAFTFITKLSLHHRVRPRKLAFFAVDEYSLRDEGHFHVLLGKSNLYPTQDAYENCLINPLNTLSKQEMEQFIVESLVSDIESQWKRQYGSCVVKPFDRTQYPNGHRYLVKILSGEPEGAHNTAGYAKEIGYENITVYPSRGLKRLLKGLPKNKDGYYLTDSGETIQPVRQKSFVSKEKTRTDWYNSVYKKWLPKVKYKHAVIREMDAFFENIGKEAAESDDGDIDLPF
jgi:hypothetical protein